eukprot:m.725903 g.725903  ORF g.725903 m.725903 type:complete len:65 (+) comp23028_c0_seq43:2008-2202(+)
MVDQHVKRPTCPSKTCEIVPLQQSFRYPMHSRDSQEHFFNMPSNALPRMSDRVKLYAGASATMT